MTAEVESGANLTDEGIWTVRLVIPFALHDKSGGGGEALRGAI